MSEFPPKPPSIRTQSRKEGVLSFSQESLWYLFQLDPSNLANNSIYLFRLKGRVDRLTLERAMNELVRRHENLRTIYPNRGGQPLQVIRSYEPFPLKELDFSSLPHEEQESALSKYTLEQRMVPLNLIEGPVTRFALLRTSFQEGYLFFATHHIGFDAWSRHILIGDLVQLYDSYQSGNTPGIPDLPIQYLDFALWQRDWLKGDTLHAFIAHWKNILSGELPTLDLPTDRPRPAMQTYKGGLYSFSISPVFSTRIKEFCQKERLTPFHLFLAAYALLLMRHSGQEDIILGCPFTNRPLPELNGLIGTFINTLPIRLNLSGDPSVRDLLKQVCEVMLDAFTWQAAPIEILASEISPQREISWTPVFQVLINMRNAPKRPSAIDGLEIERVLSEGEPAAFDISLELDEEGDCFNAAVRYNVGLFDDTTILHMVSHYQNILAGMLNRPEDPLSELEMLTPLERQRLTQDWNTTQKEIPQQSLYELIAEQTAKNPNAPAVICNGRQLAYSALGKRANQLSAYLQASGVGTGTLVGIFLPRSEDLLVSQLAVLKSGGAYVSLDLTYPAERLAYILQDANPALVITQSAQAIQLPDHCQKICLDAEADAIRACPDRGGAGASDGDAIIYVTYTSGSTGRPKGVVNVQRGVLNYLHHLVRTFQLKAGERVIQLMPLSFDAACRDTLGVLAFGGTVILTDDEQMRNPDFISATIVEQRITCILSIVPTMLRAVARLASARGAQENQLRLIMPSGEDLQVMDVELARNAFGKNVRIINQYGPTECSMIATMYPVPAAFPDDIQAVPIGKPISNVRVYVLDQNRQPVPAGVKGELYIGGIAVGRGYLNRLELTEERFLPDPFQLGGRMYRTGDLARFSKDGTLSFLGRLDHQVKIRGYRVELGEIEAVARECRGIRDAAVVWWADKSPKILAAYITVAEGKRELAQETLKLFLADRLPFYMLPSTIMVLDEMPLTSNCKIDRRALLRPEAGRIKNQYVAPRNDTETRLVSIWKEVLEVKRVGIKDNFFELGGHSLLAVRLFARIQDEFGQALPLLLLFKDGTVEALAMALADDEKATLHQ